jgi:hypothetical protein
MRIGLRSALTLTMTGALLLSGAAWAGGPVDPNGGEVVLGHGGGLKYISETLAVGSSGHFDPNSEAAWIACGPHSSSWKPTTGGSTVSGSRALNKLTSFRPMDLGAPFENPDDLRPDDWWDSSVESLNGRTLTGFAVCSQKPIRYVRTETPQGPSSNRIGTSTCPDGKVVVGGGAFIATTGSYINASYPAADNLWRARIFDTNPTGLGGMETYAICRGKAVATRTQLTTGIAADSAAQATAWCPSDRHVMGGGGRLFGPIDEAHLAASVPVDGPDAGAAPDDGWRAVGYNASGADKSLRAYALCVATG